MLVYGIGNYQAIWKTCLAQAPCEKKFFKDSAGEGGFGLSKETVSDITFIKNCKIKHFKEMMNWWDQNVSEKTDAATLRNGITENMLPPFASGNSRLASHQQDTLHTMYNLSDEQDIVPTKAAWNVGATIHMDNKPDNEPVTHGGAGAGGDNEGFDSWFNEIATTLGDSETKAGTDPYDDDGHKKTETGLSSNLTDLQNKVKNTNIKKGQAGGDNDPIDNHPGTIGTGSSSNLKDRVAALEAKLVALESQKVA